MAIRIDRVVTRGGDGGETALGDGSRVRKDHARIEAVGAVDEANAALGLLRASLPAAYDEATVLARLQNDLFDLGGDLCMPAPGAPGERGARLADTHLQALDDAIAALNARLAPLTSFVLPGGTPAAALAHLARTIARRAERRAVSLAAEAPLNPVVIRYLNRLSDYLFVLSRHLNADGAHDIAWVPGQALREG